MKVFISADMEGISGLPNAAMTETDDRDFGRARELMTADVNAAVEGALAAGATQIVVRDAHGTANNLLPEKMPGPAEVIQGWTATGRMMEGIDESFDAALLIGYHAKSLTPGGTIAHTMTGVVRRLWYNDVEIGESAISAAHAGHFGVPLVFASGDEALSQEVLRIISPRMGTAVVKSAYGRQCIRLLALTQAHQRIRDGVKLALERRAEVAPYCPACPIRLKMRFQTLQQAEGASRVPTIRRLDELTVEGEAADGLAAADLVCTLYGAAR